METTKPDGRRAAGGRSVRLWLSHIVIGVVAFAIGTSDRPPDTEPVPPAVAEAAGPTRVTGIGGVFFKSDDPAALVAWYRTPLGLATQDWNGLAFQWREQARPTETGYTIWSVFPESTDYFSPGDQSFLVNFRVANLERLVTQLKDEGIETVEEIEQHPNGAW